MGTDNFLHFALQELMQFRNQFFLFFFGSMLTTDFLPHLFSLNPELENLFFSGPVTDSILLCYLFTIKDHFNRVLADLEQAFCFNITWAEERGECLPDLEFLFP